MSDSNSLNAQRIQQTKGLYSLSENFRNQFNKLVDSEIDKAKTLVAQLSKLSLEGKTETVEVPKKKRGRPLGSVNSTKKTKVKKEKVVSEPVTTETVERTTHASAIKSVLTKDGMSAGQVHAALSALKIAGYTAPSKPVLYTSLSNLHSKGLIRSKGEKPNVVYVAG